MQTGYFTTKMNSQSHLNALILASTSPYRQSLLARLGIPFSCHAPQVDESPLAGETTVEQTRRLALAKAENVAATFPGDFVVGSDQLAEIAGVSIGKPGNEEKAIEQLMRFSGHTINFHTSVSLVCKNSSHHQLMTVKTEIQFRHFDEKEARSYVELDRPLDCAGAIRSEAAGPVLLRAMHSSDPTAIIGLPLIALSEMLRQAGFKLP
jgi:septum formation protein